ncbi:MAG: glycosyltransferase [Ilumatobacteraceae bacterium]
MASPSTPSESVMGQATPGGAVPGVVAAVVVAPSSPDLADVLASLAAQDYPTVQVVLLVTSADEAIVADHRRLAESLLPAVQVRGGGDVGLARAANQVLRLVDGDGGLFVVMHDDVALAPDAIRQLVEEMFRSNAGILGPKLVRFDAPDILSSVGYDVDRFGELDDGLEPLELDQEQHDATGDKFALSSACLLVRADLFRRLDGFDVDHPFHGEGLDLCWRAHIAGARVVVVPDAVARHRQAMHHRAPELMNESDAERQRLATVVSATGGLRLVTVIPGLVILGLATALVALLRGRPRAATARLAAIVSLATGLPRLVARRRRIAAIRTVPDREIADLQVRGSVRWNRFRRGRALQGELDQGAPTKDRSTLSAVVWTALVALLLIGGRRMITDGVSPVGELLPIPESPVDMIRSHLSGWWDRGLGDTTAQPTGLLLLGIAGLAAFAQMGLLQTVGILGALVVGWWGVSRLVPGRGGLVATVAYAAVPLPFAAIASGRLAALVAYAVVPWVVVLARRVVDETSIEDRVSSLARLVVVVTVAAAFAPAAAVVALVVLVVVAVAALLAGDTWRRSVITIAAGLVAFTGAIVLQLPWSLRFLDGDGWLAVVGAPERLTADRGLWRLMTFDIGPAALGGFVIALYVALLVGLIVARSARLAGAFTAVLVSSVFLALAVTADGGAWWLPQAGVLLAPVAFGLALGAGTLYTSFQFDVRGGRFGLRQPVSLIALAAVAVGCLPIAAVAVDGHWKQPSTSFVTQLDELLADPMSSGDYRVLVVGDPELVPGADRFHTEGIAYSIVDGGRFDLNETWSAPDSIDGRVVDDILTAMAVRSTARAGRLMAPFGIRYVVVPVIDRVRSTSESPRPLPGGLIDALREQLDLRAVYSPASMFVFENEQWISTTAMLSDEAAAASELGGADALVRTEFGSTRPVLAGTTAWSSPIEPLGPGYVHLGIPFDDRWWVDVDGRRVDAQGSFGSVMAFPLETRGEVALHYERPVSRWAWLAVQIVVWAGALVAIRRRRHVPEIDLSPVIQMTASPLADNSGDGR